MSRNEEEGWQMEHKGPYSDLIVNRGLGICWKVTDGHNPAPHVADRELAILKELWQHRHDCIVELSTFRSIPGETLELSFPFYEQSVLTYIQGKDSQALHSVIHDVSDGLAYLHSLGIIHRDICPNNIVVAHRTDTARAIIIDFGISWSPRHTFGEEAGRLHHEVGTGSFRAPELLFGCTDYDETIDLWSLGCTIHQLAHPAHTTLFQGGESDMMLILSIFRTLGTPTNHSWHDAARLPSFSRVEFCTFPEKLWSEILPIQDTLVQHVVAQLVVFNTVDRLKASQVASQLQRAV